MGLSRTGYKWVADALDMAAERLECHICNDLALENTSSNYAMVEQMIAASDYPDNKPKVSPDGREIWVMDWQVVQFCASLARKEYEDY